MAPVNTENTPGNDASFRWRQNFINVKAFLMMVGNDQCEPPRDPRNLDTGRGGGRGGGGGSAGQRAGSTMPLYVFLLREHVRFCVTQSREAGVFYLNVLWKMHWSLKTHRGTRKEIKVLFNYSKAQCKG